MAHNLAVYLTCFVMRRHWGCAVLFEDHLLAHGAEIVIPIRQGG